MLDMFIRIKQKVDFHRIIFVQKLNEWQEIEKKYEE